MHDDLLDAQAAVNWAVAQFDSLKARLIAWRKLPPYRFVEEPHPDTSKKFICLKDVKQPDPIINAEVGAIINSIRSSLDILITSVAARPTAVAPKDGYFPIAGDHAKFLSGDYKGSKVIKGLPTSDQTILENLEPWRGGNNPLLIALHDLDNLRKHRRLIDLKPTTDWVMLTRDGPRRGVSFQQVWRGFEEDAVAATVPADRTYSDIQMAIEITLNEGGLISDKHVIAALDDFACLAHSIIDKFN